MQVRPGQDALCIGFGKRGMAEPEKGLERCAYLLYDHCELLRVTNVLSRETCSRWLSKDGWL